MKNMKKSTLTTVAMLSILAAMNSAFAAAPTSPSGQSSGGLAAGFMSLEQYIGTLYGDAKEWVHGRDHRPIPHLAKTEAINNPQTQLPGSKTPIPAAQATAQIVKQETSGNLHNTLMQFNYAMYSRDKNIADNMKDANGKPFKNYMNENSLTALTIGQEAAAGDTLSVQDTESKISTTYLDPNNKAILETPNQKHNDYLDFSTLLNDMSYTPTQQIAAKNFVKYAAQNTQDLTSDVNFSKLYGSPSALLALKQNPTYQKYVMTMRQLVAIRSMSVNSLNQLIAERTPMPGLGEAAGLAPTSAPGVKPASYPSASPLQVEQYQATRRTQNPEWYASLQKASPATLQRETLIVLAEIEHQNFQAHLDRERLLAAMTALNLQMSAASTETTLKEATNKVNTAIQTAVGGASGSSTGSSNDSVGTTNMNTTNTNMMNSNTNTNTNTTNTQKTKVTP